MTRTDLVFIIIPCVDHGRLRSVQCSSFHEFIYTKCDYIMRQINAKASHT